MNDNRFLLDENDLMQKGLELREAITEVDRVHAGVLHDKIYEAYIVGGAVRDRLMGITPKDIDLTTNCPMSVLKEHFKTTAVGEQFGTLIIHYKSEQFEVTQFRSEKYNGTRKPEVEFGGTILEDLNRRDFTINAIAWDGTTFIDPHGGIIDIKNKVLRFVGNHNDRVKEDPLRIMRYFRFGARFGMEMMGGFFDLSLLDTLSCERIREELNKGILMKNSKRYFDLLYSSKTLSNIMPELHEAFEFKNEHSKDLKEHMLDCMSVGADYNNLKVRWAALLHDIGKPATYKYEDGKVSFKDHNTVGAKIVEKIMTRLKFSGDIKKFVVNATDRHMGTFQDFTDKGVKKLYEIFGKDLPLFLEVKMADYLGHRHTNIHKLKFKMKQMAMLYTKVIDYMHRVIENEQAFKITDLAISGNDLIKEGYRPGPMFGHILNQLLELVVDGELKNDKDVLLNYVNCSIETLIK